MDIKLSKRLSKALRHDPAHLGLTLDAAGWTDVSAVLAALRVDRETLDAVVAENNKQRFAYDETGTRIRASQGHSVPVDLGLLPATPPDVLYHGTVAAALPSIEADGLRPMNRHHVHLSATRETAVTVGARRGKPVILVIDAARMAADGHVFHVSANGVWLTDHVGPAYFDLPGGPR
ncbi:putative RNA 2'-phosphotransferase [Actinokineospora alba]|uniref:Probable RNA 2'-phosphotransferase n=1 Tax=Actinokineospora alba TaxID=504798 RepID=A0A1H0MVK5_9PSEU|nr:RNA 2'-phosphotransferase [Actinokineospora alba]TDP68448.1 putative RNA 2'-phosphotransferase [Actinokineospora alba]SDH79284.1 putative RNA 2'-phosphotransferase [Actinokineospora alba]SDO84335.1 putative RNA 2'-phosphotransferase [Actinokineospora alba]